MSKQVSLPHRVVELIERDYKLVPLQWARAGGLCSCGNRDCDSVAKHPIHKEWQQRATSDRATVESWHRRWPSCNWGWMMGDEFITLDLDRKRGEDGVGTLHDLESKHGPLPRTCYATTASGAYHLILRNPNGARFKATTGWRPGIDIRSGNSQIVVEPSVTPKGMYKFGRLDEPGIAPDWLLEMLPRRDDNEAQAEADFTLDEKAGIPERAQRLLDSEPKGWFTSAFRHDGKSPGDGSGSAWDHKVLREYLRRFPDAGDQELADLLCAHRKSEKGGGWDKRKSQERRTDYAKRTIGAAREAAAADQPDDADEADPAEAPDEPFPLASIDEADPLEAIVVSGDLPAMTNKALLALTAANHPPHLFTRGLELTRIAPDDEQRPVINPLDAAALRGELARATRWVSIDAKGKRHIVHPPMSVVLDIQSLPHRGDGFPPLTGIIEAPALRPDGTLITTAGYDRATRLWYQPAPGLHVPEIPDQPTAAEVAAALELIEDAIGQFPFVGEAARANAYALLLTPVVRPAVAGPVPLALLDAPQQGTGKTLFASVAALIATGRPVSTRSAPCTEEEWRKVLTSMLRAGAGFVMFDNIRMEDWQGEYKPLESPALAAVLTAWPHYTDRVLGASREGRWPVRQTWVASGNNLEVGGDLMRRCYRVRMDAESARPWQGRRFRHPKLLAHVGATRGQLLGALLTIARSWFAAGRLVASTPDIASFELWSETVGSILAHAGIRGFLADLAAFYSEVNDTTAEWAAFLSRWLTLWPSGAEHSLWRSTRELLIAMPPDQGGLREVLPSELAVAVDSGRGVDRRFGQALKRRVGVRVDDSGLRIERSDDTHTKVALWRATTG